MHVGNIQAGAGKLDEALDQLLTRWRAAADVWRDVQSRTYDEQHLRRMTEEVHQVLPAVAQMIQVLRAAQRELEEH
jgi:hypothetical protein